MRLVEVYVLQLVALGHSMDAGVVCVSCCANRRYRGDRNSTSTFCKLFVEAQVAKYWTARFLSNFAHREEQARLVQIAQERNIVFIDSFGLRVELFSSSMRILCSHDTGSARSVNVRLCMRLAQAEKGLLTNGTSVGKPFLIALRAVGSTGSKIEPTSLSRRTPFRGLHLYTTGELLEPQGLL